MNFIFSNKLIFSVLVLVFVLFSFSCKEKDDYSVIQNHWSGLNPVSVPLNVRQKEMNKGNLVSNPSFELGRFYTVDSTRLSFNLPGWRRLGEDVSWTDTENNSQYDSDDASAGVHAIKIQRNSSNETEVQGQGILSDFIKIIPGNYELSFDIKLSGVRSNQHRMGTGIYDAVNIRLFCYDRNKVLLKNELIHPLFNRKIDNSFKGFGFSNYFEVNNFEWGRIVGRSASYPFEEGYLPEEARYVKIFAGLKGDGIMWVDRFDFRYSDRNFTLLERIQPYFDSTIEKSFNLIPLPQKASYPKKIKLVRLDEGSEDQLFPLILKPGNADRQTQNSLIRLRRSLAVNSGYENTAFSVVTREGSITREKTNLVFSFGNNYLSEQYREQLPFRDIHDKPQAYFIKRITQLENVVFVGYSDLEGLHHALHSLMQLIDFKDNIYHHYDIVDFPDYLKRSLIASFSSSERNNGEPFRGFELLSGVGINQWIHTSDKSRVSPDDLGLEYKAWSKADLKSSVFPYHEKGINLDNLGLPLLETSEESEAKAEFKLFRERLRLSAIQLATFFNKMNSSENENIILSDKAIWESVSSNQSGSIVLDFDRFTDFMEHRDYFYTNLNRQLSRNIPDIFYFPLLGSTDRGLNVYSEIYQKTLVSEVLESSGRKLLWPGSVKNTKTVDGTDLYMYNDLKKLAFADYSLYDNAGSFGNFFNYYPGRVLSESVFSPFNTRIEGVDPDRFTNEFFLHISDLTPISVIRVMTAADYLWNTSSYNPARSLWNTLVYIYGKDIAKELIFFNDLYMNILSLSLEMKVNGYNQKLDNQAEELIIQLNIHWNILQQLLTNDIEFLNELTDLKDSVISGFYLSQKLSLEERNMGRR